MTQGELFTKLKSIGYQVAYHNFIVDRTHPAPKPPYIVFLRTSDKNISSDEKVHGKFKYYQVELYTAIKDLAAEQKVEKVLDTIDTDYNTSETYIESEGVYQIVYQIKVIERR